MADTEKRPPSPQPPSQAPCKQQPFRENNTGTSRDNQVMPRVPIPDPPPRKK